MGEKIYWASDWCQEEVTQNYCDKVKKEVVVFVVFVDVRLSS